MNIIFQLFEGGFMQIKLGELSNKAFSSSSTFSLFRICHAYSLQSVSRRGDVYLKKNRIARRADL